MLRHFLSPWFSVPTSWLDTETTGLEVGRDRAVSVAIVRFENRLPVGAFSTLVNPGIPIPAEATEIHGITNEMVRGAPTIADVFALEEARALLHDAQPGAFNAPFDRNFVPPFLDPWDWPWLDCLSFVRKFDRYTRGKGRHKLSATCERRGVALPNAHNAEADATAAGELFYKLGAERFPEGYTLGQVLGWQRRCEAVEWQRHMEWRARLPPI